MISKIIKTVFTIIGWFFFIFFIIFAIIYHEFPVPLLCFLICGFLACPLIRQLPVKFKLWLRIPLSIFLFAVAMNHIPEEVYLNKDYSTNTNTDSEESKSPSTEENKESTNLNQENTPKKQEKTIEPVSLNDNENSILSEEDFKLKCTELWHDDIFFSDSIAEGDYVKLDLFVEEARFFLSNAIYTWPSSDLIEKYDLQRDFFYCGIQRENENSYIGGQINLFFSNQYDCSSSDINTGDHLIIYGEIVEFSTTSTDGYNYCSIVPRYIENNGQ